MRRCTGNRRFLGVRRPGAALLARGARIVKIESGSLGKIRRAPRTNKAPTSRRTPRRRPLAAFVLYSMLAVIETVAQQPPAKISGVVSDSSGAAIAHASVEFDTDRNTVQTT